MLIAVLSIGMNPDSVWKPFMDSWSSQAIIRKMCIGASRFASLIGRASAVSAILILLALVPALESYKPWTPQVVEYGSMPEDVAPGIIPPVKLASLEQALFSIDVIPPIAL